MTDPFITRDSPRYDVRRIASYNYGGRRFLTVTVDVGLGGIKVETSQFMPKNEPLDIQLVLYNRSIWLKGKIVYSTLLPNKRAVSGIQFVDTSLENQIVLRNFLTSLEERPKPERISPPEEGGLSVLDEPWGFEEEKWEPAEMRLLH